MKRTIQVTIETDESGRYCGEDCTFYFYSEGHVYHEDYWICGMNVKWEKQEDSYRERIEELEGEIRSIKEEKP